MAGEADEGRRTDANASLALLLSRFGVPAVATVVVGSAVGVWLAVRNRPHAISITVVAALLASPLSWPTYTLAALPTGALWWRRGSTLVLVLASPLFLWFLFPPLERSFHTCIARRVAGIGEPYRAGASSEERFQR